ncbi:Cutinase-like protein 5 [Elsinoe fawcettii]|nr:Cutinase-like protein 5 [Elsinoe fawcettii]
MRTTNAGISLLACASLTSGFLITRETNYTRGNVADDVTANRCGALTLLFARGTTEPGTLGIIVGPQLASALNTDLAGNVALQGVNYPATREGNINRGQDGGPEMARLAQLALQNCPDTKIALVGYSQGAMVVRNAVSKSGLPSENVAAIVQFGDPQRNLSIGTVTNDKILNICRAGDDVCEQGLYSIKGPHLQYGQDATTAADFLIRTVGLQKVINNTESGNATSPGMSSTASAGVSATSASAAPRSTNVSARSMVNASWSLWALVLLGALNLS